MDKTLTEKTFDDVTHKVVITLGSIDDDEAVGVMITFEPELDGSDYEALGYQPASHEFLNRFLLPVLESVYMQSEFPELFKDDGESKSVN